MKEKTGAASPAQARASDVTVPLESSTDVVPISGGVDRGNTIPEKIGPYPILKPLGHGGMGEVFLARDMDLSRPIAIKRIRRDRSLDHEIRRRFLIEARVTAMLQHPSIIPIYRFSPENQYYSMRPVEGMSLAQLLQALRKGEGREQWPTSRLVRLFLQVANAVAYAHSCGVIHRDLKPANVMIGPFEEVLVLDWGMAKIIRKDKEEPALEPLDGLLGYSDSAGIFGTPAYMAPELFDDTPANSLTDIFSLGVILWELLLLKKPWKARDVSSLVEKKRTARSFPTGPSSLDIPSRLGEVAERAIHPRPDSRFQTVAEFSRAVANALEGLPAWTVVEKSRQRESWALKGGRIRPDPEGGFLFRAKGAKGHFQYFYNARFHDNVRLEFKMYLRGGKQRLRVWLNAEEMTGMSSQYSYGLDIVGPKHWLTLRRSGRSVAGGETPEYGTGVWHEIVAMRAENRISLEVDGEPIYGFSDPIPLRHGFVGISGRSAGIRIKELRILARGTGVTVSCLSVPDAFFHRELFEDAHREYCRIAVNHPGRKEGRRAGFRAGLSLIEMARRDEDREWRKALLAEAREHFATCESLKSSCLALFGEAIVSVELGDGETEYQAIEKALAGDPDDPELITVREWVLSRIHEMDSDQRHQVAALLPVAFEHFHDLRGRQVVADLFREVRGKWERPGFLVGRLGGKLGDPGVRATATIFFGFWGGRADLISRTLLTLIEAGAATSGHLVDAFFAMLELGLPGRACELLEKFEAGPAASGDRWRPRTLLLCRVVSEALRGDLEKARKMLVECGPESGDRVSNSVRLWLARMFFRAGSRKKLRGVLCPLDGNDVFGREHSAWFALLSGDLKEARSHLRVLQGRRAHRKPLNLTNFLCGALAMAEGKKNTALNLFRLHAMPLWPRTWMLGTYCGAGYLAGNALDRYLKKAFLWERKQLYHQMALLALVGGNREEEQLYRELAEEQKAEG